MLRGVRRIGVRCGAPVLLALASLLAAGQACADEGGVPFWLSGQFASLAAVPAAPGASAVLFPYYYNASAGNSRTLSRGTALVTGLDTQVAMMLVQLGYAPEQKLWGGQPYFGLSAGYGRNEATVSGFVSTGGTGSLRSNSDSKSGGTDLYPIASVAWNLGVNNLMAYVTGDIPVGSYDPDRLSNIGIGHAAIDVGGGYTYLNTQTGREFSVVSGLTHNWRNSDTDYRNGLDLHVDWAASQFLSAQWQVGVVGYVYQQLTADSYPTGGVTGALRSQALGSFKSRVAAIGPEVGYMFKIGGKQAYANVRAYWEFWAKNRVEGYAVMGTVSIPL